MTPPPLSPKTVLVTGANRGIGLEFVRKFLALSNPPTFLFAACRKPAEAKQLQELQKTNKNLKIIQYDITNSADHARAAQEIAKTIGDIGLNLVINNAGVLTNQASVKDVTEEAMMAEYKTNAVGPLLAVKALLPMIEQAAKNGPSSSMSPNRACIVNISTRGASIADNGMGQLYPYRASKAALNMISKNLSLELGPKNILVALLHPGWVQTDLGTAAAAITTEESVSAMMEVIQGLDQSRQALLLNYKGDVIPW